MSDVLAALGVILAILALAFVVYQNWNIEKRINKRVKEELAPYSESLEAVKSLIKRPPHEIMSSMTRLPSPPDVGPITVIDLHKKAED